MKNELQLSSSMIPVGQVVAIGKNFYEYRNRVLGMIKTERGW